MPRLKASKRFGSASALAIVGFAGLLSLLLSLVATPAVAASKSVSQWKSFIDPVYGFTIKYPTTWDLAIGYDGSHITLENLVTHTTISPIVSIDSRTSAAILQAPLPNGAINKQVMVDAQQSSLNFVMPYMAGLSMGNAGRPLAERHIIETPIKNTSGTMNLYTFVATLPTDAHGNLSAAVSSDDAAFVQIVDSVRFPVSVRPANSASTNKSSPTPNIIIGGGGCGSVCWADDNWNYNKYDHSSALYCTQAEGYSGNWGSYTCGGANQSAVQAPAAGYYQPWFECAEFVARALGQDADIPGLLNGGTNGTGPATSTVGSYSYDQFRFTYVGASYSSDTVYALDNVNGLYNYLINSGLGTSIQQNMNAASLGDVVFFYSGSSLEHTMIVAGIEYSGSSVSDLLLDGHNVDDYHASLTGYAHNFSSYVIIHRHLNDGVFGQPSLSGSWNSATDGYGQATHWVYTATSSSSAAQYTISDQGVKCAVAIYVPAGNATVNVRFRVNGANGSPYYQYVNEDLIDGWALLFKWGTMASDPVLIDVSNGTGTTGQQLGIGEEAFMC